METIAQRLQQLYKHSPLPLRVIARRLGHNAFKSYHDGDTVPRIDKVPAMAEMFGADPLWLAFGYCRSGRLDVEGFAKRLQRARTRRGIAQKDLGLPQMTVSHLEAGKHFPTVDQVAVLAGKLRVQPAWLAFGLWQRRRPPSPSASR